MDRARHQRFLPAIVCVAGLLGPCAAASAAALGDHDHGDGDRGGRGDRGADDRGGERGGNRGGFVLPGEDRRRGPDEGGYGARLSLGSAIDLVLSRFGGQVVKAETQSRDGQLFYLIRVLTPDGTLVRVRVDALSGRMD